MSEAFDPSVAAAPAANGGAAGTAPPLRPTAAFIWRHPARLLAFGFGSGLAPVAPGTVGTLWAWAAYVVAAGLWTPPTLLMGIALALPLGVWVCGRSALELRQADPSSIVWDEIVAFWAVLWVIDGGLLLQAIAFALFRFFDAAKPGPVGWADRLFHGRRDGLGLGVGIVLDDVVAAGMTLLTMALGARALALWQGAPWAHYSGPWGG